MAHSLRNWISLSFCILINRCDFAIPAGVFDDVSIYWISFFIFYLSKSINNRVIISRVRTCQNSQRTWDSWGQSLLSIHRLLNQPVKKSMQDSPNAQSVIKSLNYPDVVCYPCVPINRGTVQQRLLIYSFLTVYQSSEAIDRMEPNVEYMLRRGFRGRFPIHR